MLGFHVLAPILLGQEITAARFARVVMLLLRVVTRRSGAAKGPLAARCLGTCHTACCATASPASPTPRTTTTTTTANARHWALHNKFRVRVTRVLLCCILATKLLSALGRQDAGMDAWFAVHVLCVFKRSALVEEHLPTGGLRAAVVLAALLGAHVLRVRCGVVLECRGGARKHFAALGAWAGMRARAATLVSRWLALRVLALVAPVRATLHWVGVPLLLLLLLLLKLLQLQLQLQ